jgi:hypothetical protein
MNLSSVPPSAFVSVLWGVPGRRAARFGKPPANRLPAVFEVVE